MASRTPKNRGMHRRSLAFAGFAIVTVQWQPVLADSARAPVLQAVSRAEQASTPDLAPWHFNLAAYAWLINLGGNFTAHNQTIDTSASFIDLVQKSDSLFATMAYFEANKGWAGFYADFVFTKLGFGAGQTTYRNPIAGLRISTRETLKKSST